VTLTVQKFGGSSLATSERIRAVAGRIHDSLNAGDRLAVVVSAMGDTTDDLTEMARRVGSRPPVREMDFLLSTGELVSAALMAMALNELGRDAVALSGPQAGIRTDGRYGRARITEILPTRIFREIKEGRVPVVAGFQGLGSDGDLVTLARGTSDTSAVALAVALGVDKCEIYTDVDGIFSADPRIVPAAQKLDFIVYEEMLEMAKLGARVIHPRAVEIAEHFSVPVMVRSSFSDSVGTKIVEESAIQIETMQRVRAIAHDMDVARVTVRGVSDRRGLAKALFEPLAMRHINIDVIVQNVSDGGITDVSFTVSKNDLDVTLDLIKPVAAEIGARDVVSSTELGKVSIVGVGIQSTPGIAARMFGSLASAGINIVSITTSEIRITCLVNSDDVADATVALHKEFGLDEKPA
jgi:aspartate kinase